MKDATLISPNPAATQGAGVYKNEVRLYHGIMEREFGNYTVQEPLLIYGTFENAPGWLLYIIVNLPELDDVLARIAVLTKDFSFALAIPENSNIAGQLLDGTFSDAHAGKLITIQTTDVKQTDQLVKALIALTELHNGPDLSNGYYLGGRVYCLYERPMFYPRLMIESNDIVAQWPFSIKQDTRKRQTKRIGKYLLTSVLKTDMKGNVYKCISVKNVLNIRWCVMKQGKAHASSDEFGRDVRDRLKWQSAVHDRLKDLDILPAGRDLFEEGRDTYFIMDFVEGIPYHQYVSEVQEGTIFKYLGVEKQIDLLNRAMELIQLVAAFHHHGLLHRDISPTNFIVEHSGKLKAIDAELSYDLSGEGIFPWFTLGTEGYMSPQQRNLSVPVVQDDIYGLGGIILFSLTGVSPSKFETLMADGDLFEHINFFADDRRLSAIIAACRNTEPLLRPDMASIHHNIDLYRAKLLTRHVPATLIKQNFQVTAALLGQSVASFTNMPVSSLQPNKLHRNTPNCSFDDGVAGLIYTLAVSDKLGVDFSIAKNAFPDLLQTLISEVSILEVSAHYGPGLIQGRFGMAITISLLIKESLIEHHIDRLNLVSLLLASGNLKTGLYDGVAGQGLAMMKCAELLNFPNMALTVPEMAEYLISRQNRDGSWDAELSPAKSKKVQLSGLYHGVAGIVYFLIVAHHRFYDSRLKTSAERGLKWLADQRKKDKLKGLLPISSESKATDPWLEAGFTGVAFVFLKAYEFWRTEEHGAISQAMLDAHPQFITSNYNSFSNGLSGIGEVYLEAYRVFQTAHYLDRANQIAEFLMHTNCMNEGKGMYWLEGNDHKPLPGFTNGNAGILHFLSRVYAPTNVEFPLIDFRP